MSKKVGWTADGIFYNNKVKALEQVNWNASKIQFSFKDQELTTYDFSVQHKKDFDTLCLEALLKLRQSYKHLCLWFTAGTDSGTILHLFEKYNIPLDEILFYDRKYNVYDMWDDESAYVKNEMDRFKKVQPNCKLTVVHIDYDNARKYYTKNKAYWFYEPHINIRFSKNLRYNIVQNNPELAREFEKPTRCDIFAREKPRLILDQDKWYMTFFDNIEYDTYYIGFHHFFWDNLDIMCKQAHLAVDYFESLPNFTQELLHKVQSWTPGPQYSEYCKAIGLTLPKWKYLSEGWSKPSTNRNSKLYESYNITNHAKKDDRKIFDYYDQGVKYIGQNIDLSNGSECIGFNMTKTYFLKNKQIK